MFGGMMTSGLSYPDRGNTGSIGGIPREFFERVGLPKDEIVDTGHWPNQLYIGEGRRLLGQYVMRQQDLQVERTKPDSIAMGSYNSDSHNVQRIAMPDRDVRMEATWRCR